MMKTSQPSEEIFFLTSGKDGVPQRGHLWPATGDWLLRGCTGIGGCVASQIGGGGTYSFS